MTEAIFHLPVQPQTWVFCGDSITQAALHTYGARGWAEHLAERVRFQLERPLDLFVNSGISGWTAAQVLGQYDHLAGRFSPDILHLALGTNDAVGGLDALPGFRRDMARLVDLGQRGGAQVVLHTPALLALSGRPQRGHLPAFAGAVRELAAASGAVLVDHEAYWQAHWQGREPIGWLADAIHPNAAGHVQMAQLTLRTLGLGELGGVNWSG